MVLINSCDLKVSSFYFSLNTVLVQAADSLLRQVLLQATFQPTSTRASPFVPTVIFDAVLLLYKKSIKHGHSHSDVKHRLSKNAMSVGGEGGSNCGSEIMNCDWHGVSQ